MKKRYIIKRILQVLPVAIGVIVFIFLLLHSMPGDFTSALLGPEASVEDVERIREQYGLNENVFVQLINYMRQLVTFDFGDSIIFKKPVSEMISTAFPATLELAIMGMVWALIIAVPLGILSAVKQNSWIDNISMVLAQLGISMPVFWMGLLMILLFSVKLNWLPSFGRGMAITEALNLGFTTGSFAQLSNSFKKLLMPSFALGIMGAAMISRMIRSTMLEVLDIWIISAQPAQRERRRSKL